MEVQEAVRLLERKFKNFKGAFTLNDAATATGLAVEQAREALDAMMSKYICALKVTENGDLIYSFGPSLRRRGRKTFGEIVEEVADWAWRVFKVMFKVWITVTLVVYFVIFLVLLIALIVAASSRGGDRKSSIRLDGVFRAFFSLFQWHTVTSTMAYRTDRQGYRYRAYEPRTSPIRENKKSFVASVYDFVFGPTRVEIDPLANQKEVAAYLRKEKGVVTPAELVALAGWRFDEADRFLSDCLVRFQGDPVIAESGVVYGKFDQITRSAGDAEDGKIEYFWDEYEPDYEITGNTTGRNAGIIFMNVFNLAFASLVVAASMDPSVSPQGSLEPWVVSVLGFVPMTFSLLFFLIPVVRIFRVSALRARRTKTNIRKRVMRAVFNTAGQAVTLEEAVEKVNAGASEQKLAPELVKSALEEMLRDYEGEIVLDPRGRSKYSFPRVERELDEAGKVRESRVLDKDLGKVLYDSQN